MSFIYSQALAEESLQDTFLGIDAFVQSSESPTLKLSLSPDKTTDICQLSRFGTTCAPLTEDRGAALLTSWRAGFRAKTSASPGKAQDLTASVAVSGEKWRGSFARYDQVTSSWRTPQLSLLGDLVEFSETWPRWGSMRNGESFLLPMSEHPIFESAYGLWPTPNAMPASNDLSFRCSGDGRSKPNKLGWAVAESLYPTPVASDTGHRKSKYAQGGTALSMAAGGHLNPEWVEWLMGWPIGWTALEPLGTGKYQEWLQQHGKF